MRRHGVNVRCPACGWRTHRVARDKGSPFGRCRCGGTLSSVAVVMDAGWRHRRAVEAGKKSRESYRRRQETEAEKYATKGVAYAAGYRRGYQTAMAWARRRQAVAS